MGKGNIETLPPFAFHWQDGKRLQSLTSVYAEVRGKIEDAIGWYQSGRIVKRALGGMSRYLAIFLGVVAAAMPTITEMALKTNQPLNWWQQPGIATILGLFVGGLLMLDKFAGGTSGWIRYTMAETALKELRDALSFIYANEESQWAGQAEPNIEQTKHALSALQEVLNRANQIVHSETDQWKAEFQSALQQTEEYAKAQPKKVEEAVATVKITNPDRLAGKWLVSFNDSDEHEVAGDSKAFHTAPGPLTVHVTAVIKANPDGSRTREFKTEVAEILATGTTKAISITLPPE